MNPYRQPQLKFIAPEFLKTPLKRKIKFAWNFSNRESNESWLIAIHSFVVVAFLIFENNWILGSILTSIVITITRMLWSWFSFINEAKQRNKHTSNLDEIGNYKTFGFVSLPLGTKYKYMCSACNMCFSAKCKATSHMTTCHNDRITFIEV